MNQPEVALRLKAALATLYERDYFLLELDVGERAIAGKLACYLAHLFGGYDVDVEYNRHGLDPKALRLPPDRDEGGDKRIIPDIIIHRRGQDEDNLVVVEIKKETNVVSRTYDRAKVQAMKEQYRYVWGVLLEFPAGHGARNRQPLQEWL